MRRTAVLTVFLASTLWGVSVGLAPAASATGTITVPPTVNATTWTVGTIPSSGPGGIDTLHAVSCTTSDLLRGDRAERRRQRQPH